MNNINNVIGLFGFGPAKATPMTTSIGGASLFKIDGHMIAATSSIHLKNLPDNCCPKFLFKIIDTNETKRELVINASPDSLSTHFCDNIKETNGLLYISCDDKNLLIGLPNLTTPPVIAYDAEKLTISGIDQNTIEPNQELFNIRMYKGKNFNLNEPLIVDEIDKRLINQKRVEFGKNSISQSLYPGGFVYKEENQKVIPIGIITTIGKGISRQYFEGKNKDIDFVTYYSISRIIDDVLHSRNEEHLKEYSTGTQFFLDNVRSLRNKIEIIVDVILSKDILINSKKDPFHKNKSKWKSQLRSEFLSTRFNLFLVEQSLLNEDWWEISHRNKPPSQDRRNKLIEGYNKTIFRGFLISIFSVLEHCLRENLRRINPDACNNARDSFHNVVGYLISRLSIEEKKRFKKLFKLFRTIRNSIHNDGYYYPEKKPYKDKIQYANKIYEFSDQEIIPINWEDLIVITEDAAKFLVEFLNDDLVKNSFK